jgi:UDP-glucose 4-epimerase
MTKIVVTGGAGFIGSHIVEEWINKGACVHIIDNLRSGYEKNIPVNNNVVFHKESITNRKKVFEIMEGADYVHNLAAMVSVPESIIKPLDCVDINVIGLINILDAAKENKVKKVVHSSSAAVYGDNPVSPKLTTMTPQPKTPYGITKLDGEYYLNAYKENFGINTASLRYFNVFGTRQDPAGQYAAVIPIFVEKALKNEPIVIFGDGGQTRDFIYIKDVVAANILAAENDSASGVFNVANGKSITIKQLAELIIEQTGSSSKIIYEKERPGDIRYSLASIDDTRKVLGFDPKYDLITGLKITIDYFVEEFRTKS